ncbi:MAG: 16S rRNA (guanine(527)-N(7))-methyltransferase RsmG [Nitrospinota bacterium]
MDKNELIKKYLAELYRWNKAINLTSVAEDKAEELLVKPSLAMIEFLPDGGNLEVTDIGSGAGIPAVALAVHLPRHNFTLIESNGKKASFLKHIAQHLKLSNVNILNERAESSELTQCADVVTARAVNRKTVFDAAQKFLKPGGILLIHSHRTFRRSSKEEPTDNRFRKTAENEFVERYKLLH